ncbi:class I adenylate-forming enzyme family protein [Thermoactinomyces sp. CICC 10523]|uniref:class I adenylate-forming enzyme family protein n=1 Tax=Thermoactinomyces sp. CICC 10523 TaxID=2767428 RepID=UPI00351C5133
MGTIDLFLKQRAADTPDLEALVGGGRRFTFREFNERVNQLAHYLREIGLQKGDRVAILCKNNHPFPTIALAAIKSGGIAVPLNWRLTAYEIEEIIKNCRPKALFYDEEFAPSLTLAKEAGIVGEFIPVGTGMETTPFFESIFENRPVDEPVVEISKDDPAYILFTSGSTGTPKGCVISHGGFYAYLKADKAQSAPGYRSLAVHPLFHMSSTLACIRSIYFGGATVFLSDDTPAKIWEMIEQEKINYMFGFPSLYTYMLEELKRHPRKIDSLKGVSAGGVKVPVSLIKQYMEIGIPMSQGYGSTEAWTVSRWSPEMGLDKAESVGKLYPNVEVKIVDPETDNPLPTGEVGEIVVKSPYLFKGYWQNPQATDEVLRDGWFHMGDAGYLDADGFLYVIGRYKDVIVYGGDNIYPAEIEKVLQAVDGVLEAAVVGIPDPFWGEVPRAFVVKSPDSPLTEEALTRVCKEKLAAYKVPQISFARSLPKSGTGKVLKHVLKEKAAALQ